MALPAVGSPISFSQVNVELGLAATAQISLNDSAVRTLFDITSGAISMSDGFGKSAVSDPGGSVLLVANETAGLRGVGRTGYHNENVNYTDTTNQGPFGPYPDALNISGFASNISRLYRGYFVPAVTGNYRFRLSADDGAYMWVGSNATSGYTIANSYINNGGLHGLIAITGNTLFLTQDLFYPVRIVYGNSGGAGQVTLEWEGPGQAFTTTLTNRVVYNSITNGF
jgi:hypothetical protein